MDYRQLTEQEEYENLGLDFQHCAGPGESAGGYGRGAQECDEPAFQEQVRRPAGHRRGREGSAERDRDYVLAGGHWRFYGGDGDDPTPARFGGVDRSHDLHAGNTVHPQAFGSAITYCRRYGLQSLVGLPADDDDGNAGSVLTEKLALSNIAAAKSLANLQTVWEAMPVDVRKIKSVAEAKAKKKADFLAAEEEHAATV
jgi:hypothetical protein